MGKILYFILLSLLGTMIIHICILLLAPYYLKNTLWTEQIQNIIDYQFHRLSADHPLSKRSDPFLKQALCSFDLTERPIRVLMENNVVPFWSLSLYSQTGTILYHLNSRSSNRDLLDIIISTPYQTLDLKQIVPTLYPNSLMTTQNITKGFLILRVLQPTFQWEKQVTTFLTQTSCNQLQY